MYTLSFDFLRQYYPMLLQGAGVTLLLTVCSLALGFLLGIIVAIMRRSSSKIFRAIGAVWVEVLRNTPFLVQLFFFYYGLPELGINTNPILTGIIALSVNISAANCEVIRSGLMAVKNGYYECAYALGYSKFQTLRYFILPISLRIAFRPLTNNFINLVLNSSATFSITIVELMGSAKIISAYTSRPFEIYIIILVGYCIFTFVLSFISKYVDKRIAINL
ncbi:MAG: amino acid ABC transporter permease [Bacillota bacterium]|nr:amino acid ABC transporter permease [Bacillota bacterium]